MKLATLNLRFKRKHRDIKYYKCNRCGYIDKHSAHCPVCRKEGKLVKLKR